MSKHSVWLPPETKTIEVLDKPEKQKLNRVAKDEGYKVETRTKREPERETSEGRDVDRDSERDDRQE